jgi:hypothetical protein
VALALAVAMLLDPMFFELYRGGRIDGWPLAICLASAWMLRRARSNVLNSVPAHRPALLAGALVPLSVVFWISAPMLFPLVLLEWVELIRAARRVDAQGRNHWLRVSAYIALGGISMGAILAVPLLLRFDATIASFLASVELQTHSAMIKHPLAAIFLVYTPVLFVSAAFALLTRREWGMILACAAAVLMAQQTAVYPARAVYLIPYGFAFVAYAFSGPLGPVVARARTVLVVLLAGLLSYNAGTVLVARPAEALAVYPANDPGQFQPRFERIIGRGPHRVLLMEWHLYYVARELGWHYYRSNNPIGGQEYTNFIASMDYVILRERPLSQGTISRLHDAGFELEASIPFPEAPVNSIGWWFFERPIYAEVYPTINVYSKRAPVRTEVPPAPAAHAPPAASLRSPGAGRT